MTIRSFPDPTHTGEDTRAKHAARMPIASPNPSETRLKRQQDFS